MSESRPRPGWRTRLGMIMFAALACTAMLLGLAGPASASGTKCSSSGNACEDVYNGSAGNPFIYWVKVWNPADAGVNETYRLLVNGSVIGSASGTSGYTFQVNRFFNPGTCIRGQVVGPGFSAQTPCWTVP